MNTRKALASMAAISTLALGMTTLSAAPASAGEVVRRQCLGYGGQAAGATTRNEGLTYDLAGGCGTRMGVRVFYSHMGGSSWSSWKTVDPRYTPTVKRSVYPNIAKYSEHYAGGTGNFISNA